MYVDCDLSMRTHGQGTVSRCFAALRQIRRSVPSATLQMLVVALVHSRLDYGNGVLVGLPAYKSTPVGPERGGSTDLPPEHPKPHN